MNFEFLKSFFKNFQKSEVESRPSRPFQFSPLGELQPEKVVRVSVCPSVMLNSR